MCKIRRLCPINSIKSLFRMVKLTEKHLQRRFRNSVNIYLFRKRCKICSKLLIRHQSDVNDVVLLSFLLTLNIFRTFLSVSVVDFEQIDVNWKGCGTKPRPVPLIKISLIKKDDIARYFPASFTIFFKITVLSNICEPMFQS